MRVRIPDTHYSDSLLETLSDALDVEIPEMILGDFGMREAIVDQVLTEDLVNHVESELLENEVVVVLQDGKDFAVIGCRSVVSSLLDLPDTWRVAAWDQAEPFEDYQEDLVVLLIDKDKGNEQPYLGLVEISCNAEEPLTDEDKIGIAMARTAAKLQLKDLSLLSKIINPIGVFKCSST